MSGKRQLARRPARRPAQRRTVDVRIAEGPFAGWEATALVDFPARLLTDLNSGDIDRVLEVMAKIIVSHNMPNDQDQIAEHLADVDPFTGLVAIAGAIGDAIGSLPNR